MIHAQPRRETRGRAVGEKTIYIYNIGASLNNRSFSLIAFKADFIPKNFHLFTKHPIINCISGSAANTAVSNKRRSAA